MDNEDEDVEFPEYTDEQVREILRDALKTRMTKDEPLPSRKDVYSSLTNLMSEFLACYKVIGYDLNGKPISLNVYHNNLERDALEHAFIEQVAKHIGKGPL